MSTRMKCSLCDQTFDAESAPDSLLAICPHCGKANAIAGAGDTTRRLHLLRNAPTMMGGKPCPQCRKLIAPDAELCVHCGFNFLTGKNAHAARNRGGSKALIRAGGLALLLLLALGLYWQRPKWKPALSSLCDRLAALWSAGSPAEPQTPPRAGPESGAESAARPPEGPDAVATGSPPEEDRARFDEQKARAEETLRWKLDSTAPLRKPGDKVELRRTNGQLIKGSLSGVVSDGSIGSAVIATSGGEVRIELAALDRASRLRIDPAYREKYIRNLLGIETADAPPAASPPKPAGGPQKNTEGARHSAPRPAETQNGAQPATKQADPRPAGYPFRVYDVMYVGRRNKDGVTAEYAKFSVRNYTDRPLTGTAHALLPGHTGSAGSLRLSIPPRQSMENIYIRATKTCRIEIRSNRGIKTAQWGETK